MSVAEFQRHLNMVRTPDLWPHSWYLPITRPKVDDVPFSDCGVIFALPGVPRLTVFIGVNIVMHGAVLMEAIAKGMVDLDTIKPTPVTTKDYRDFEGMLDDGWAVD